MQNSRAQQTGHQPIDYFLKAGIIRFKNLENFKDGKNWD